MSAPRTLLAVVILLAITGVSNAADKLYNKSDAQVLKMGQKKWMAYASTKGDGGSTNGMMQALDFYAKAAEKRNDKFYKHVDNSRRQLVSSIQVALKDAGATLVQADSDAAGGGSMYKVFFAGRDVDVQDFVYAMLSHGSMSKKAPSNEGVKKLLDQWMETTKKGASGDTKAQLDASVEKAQKATLNALDLCGALNEKEATGVRAVLAYWLKATDQQG